MKDEELDRIIFRVLEKSETELPAAVRDNVRRRLAAMTSRPRQVAWKRIAVWAPLLAAAMLIVAFSLPLLHPPRPPERKITQIRTEFSIPGKNIRIIWVQRQDFHFPGTNG